MRPEEKRPLSGAPVGVRVEDGSPFPVVGIGASAGGLRALQAFFSRVPPECGMAFVVVSHHHAEQQSLLPELLSHSTKIQVDEASEGVVVECDHVYVAPPGHNLALARGMLRLVAPRPSHGTPLPIDSFLRSLAQDIRDRAVAIILSGTGTDGTLGVQSVKAASGLVFVQDQESAEFSGMPSSAIATGLADFVGPPEDMPERLLAWARSSYLHGASPAEPDLPIMDRESFTQILALLRARTGHDFSGYKPTTLLRRIQRRQSLHQLERLQDYGRLLEQRDEEVHALFQELLIGVTSFFRDGEAFDAVEAALLEILAAKPDHANLRVWVPGCSTGEEAYSFAILVHECIDRLNKPLGAQIFATDLDSQGVEAARHGRYPEGIASDLSKERLARFFSKENGVYRIRKEIRGMLVFATQDILGDPPFTHMDFVSCRNVLIYLGAELQRRVLALLHYTLNPGGLLLLGSSESATNLDGLFTPLDRRWKLYRRREAAPGAVALTDLPMYRKDARHSRSIAQRGISLEAASRLLARTYAPASVLVNDRADIVHVHGRTGGFLEPAQGRASINLLEMAREGLRPALTWLLREVESVPEQPAERSVRVRADAAFRRVRVTARKVAPPDPLAGLILVSFEETSTEFEPGSEPRRGEAPEREGETPSLILELERTRSDLQATIQELQSANEELASSSEEAQSMNEELQSANEELETSREEMQSLNEELQTVNAELRAKLNELSQASDDRLNLLNSTSVATLFLDRNLCIKRFTPDIAAIIPLQPSDVGRPLAHLALRVDHERLAEDAAEVLRTLAPREREIPSNEGETTYLMRIGPYRTSQNAIDGLVMTFVDITRLKEMEAASEVARAHAEAIVETVRQPLLTLDAELRVQSVNRAFCELFETSRDAVEGLEILELPRVRWDLPGLRQLLQEILPRNNVVEGYALACEFPTSGRRTVRIDAIRMPVEGDRPTLILLAISVDP
jgi:two-component system, chemotaxis family, CheB/CheR fusion protein